MNYEIEIQSIVADNQRATRMLQEEYEEMRQRLTRNGAELVAAMEEAEERIRVEVEEQERLAAEEREQREAIARSIAARKSKGVVTPIDEDDDPESEYYRRKSWLI
ncbi:hypothetical protein [Nocardia xishanensis]